jgi:peroxiredoxin
MKKTTVLIGIIFFATIFGCKESTNKLGENEFILNGELEGIENDSWIYLMLNNKSVDSTKIANNKFSIKGITEHPKQYYLLVENSQNYSPIWLESGELKFRAKDGEFKDALIEGSNSQKESEKLWKPIWEYRKHRDSIRKILNNNELNDNLKSVAKLEQKKIEEDWLKAEKDFIKNNPESYVSAATLDGYTKAFSKKTVLEFYNNFNEDIKNSSYGISINRFLEINKNPQIGDKYVDFSMTNENGKIINLSDYEGNIILLDFWASWCGPCIEEYPALKKAYSEFSENNFEIVGLSQDQSKDKWLKAIEKNELNWVNLWNEKGIDADPYLIYGVNGIPDNFLIDEKGFIIARNLRGVKLIETIKQHMEKPTGKIVYH